MLRFDGKGRALPWVDPEQSGVIPPSMFDCVEKEKKLRRLEAQELQRSKG
jgi:hypothetical protein